jgi:peptidoglycan/LPS O-acetylase OafA/YrhL
LYFVTKPETVGGRILNSRLLVHIGLISYSLYLWQELFFGPPIDAPNHWSATFLGKFPLNLAAAFLAAELSWQMVEKPALRLRRKFERANSSRQAPEQDTLTLLSADSTEIAS